MERTTTDLGSSVGIPFITSQSSDDSDRIPTSHSSLQDQEAERVLFGLLEKFQTGTADAAVLSRLSTSAAAHLATASAADRTARRAANSCSSDTGPEAAALLSAVARDVPAEKQFQLGLGLTSSSNSFWRQQGEQLLQQLLVEGAQVALKPCVLHRLWLLAYQRSDLPRQQQQHLKDLVKAAKPGRESALLQPIVARLSLQLPQDQRETARALLPKMAVELGGTTALAGYLEELGYAATANEAAFRAVMDQLEVVSEKDVAQAFGMMARTNSGLVADPHGLHGSLIAALGSHVPKAAQPTGWKPDIVVDALKAAYPNLRWEEVAANLDYEGFQVPDESGNMLLLSAWQRAAGTSFPLDVLCGRLWANSLGQASFLRYAVGVPPHLVRWDQAPRKLAPVEGLQGKAATGTPNQAWLCLDLLDTLARLAELGHSPAVRGILELPVKQCPEVLLLGMATVRSDWSHLHLEVLSKLVVSYVASHANSAVVLHRLWGLSPNLVLAGMIALYSTEGTTITRCLDICQDLNGLDTALDSTPAAFALDLAMLAGRSSILNLQGWLQQKVSTQGVAFCQAVVEYLDDRIASAGQPDVIPASGQAGRITLSVDTLATTLRVLNLQLASGVLPTDLASQVTQLQQQAIHTHPDIAASGPRTARSESSFPPDVEAEANNYFQAVYTDGATADNLLQRLQQLQASADQREQSVAQCMIYNLFDEYRFFNKYPEKELHITAVLFAGLVQRQLVQGSQLDTLLRLVLDALRQAPGSKLFEFARETLRQVQDNLLGWPHFCSYVLQVPHFREAEPQLANKLEQLLRDFSEGRAGALPAEPSVGDGPDGPPLLGTETEGAPSSEPRQTAPTAAEQLAQPPAPETPADAPVAEPASPVQDEQIPVAAAAAALGGPTPDAPADPPAAAPAEPSIPAIPPPLQMDPNRAFQAHNLETLEAAFAQANLAFPPQQIQDKVAFVMNNLAEENMTDKAEEARKLITQEHWPWFVNYLVVRRAAQEVNHHKVYLALVDSFVERELFKQLLATSYRYIRILLASEHIKTKSGERSLLRNLGSWLGRLTLARQQPVRQKDLDLKKIVYEAYEQGKMIAVLPFVVKVMEPCGSDENQVFTKTNPWVAAILALAAEIYSLGNLKLNLKFDVEMLFRLFTLSISSYKPSDTLSCHVRDPISNPDFYPPDKPGPGGKAAPATPERPPAQAPAEAVGTPAGPAAPATPPPATAFEPPAGRQPGQAREVPVPAAGAAATQQQQQQHRSTSPTPSGPLGIPAPRPPPLEPGAAPGTPRAPDTAAGPAPPAQGPGMSSYAKLHQSCIISSSLGSLSERLQLPKIVPMAVDHAIAEIIFPTVERSVTIGRMTTIELINKDFAFEADESRMRNGAHLMAGSLSGSLALVTGREPLRHSLGNQLRGMLAHSLDGPTLDTTIVTIVNDNLDLGCSIIEKAATEKAIHEIDEHLLQGYQVRQAARSNGQTYVDATAAARFPTSLPQPLRPKAGHLSPAQMRVYEDFSRCPHPAGPILPGTPVKAADGQAADGEDAQTRHAHLNMRFSAWLARTEAIITREAQAPAPSNRSDSSELAASVGEMTQMAGDSEEGILLLARKVFTRMFEVSGIRLHTTAMAAALQSLALRLPEGRMAREMASLWSSLGRTPSDDRKWRYDAIEALLRHRLLTLPDVDAQVAEALASPQRLQVVEECAAKLVRMAAIAEQVVGPSDLPATLEVLTQAAAGSNTGMLGQLVSLATAKRAPKTEQQEVQYPAGLQDRVTELLTEWVGLQEDHPADKAQSAFVSKLDQEGFLKGGELTDQFLRLMLEAAVTYYYMNDPAPGSGRLPGAPQLVYLAADSFARLICTLITAHRGGPALLARALRAWAVYLQREADEKGPDFNGRPFFRVAVACIQELTPSSRTDAEGLSYLATIAGALLDVQPLRAPAFTFPWLELVSHRNLMPKLLLAEGTRAWQPFQRLMMALLRFLEPYLRSAHLTDAVRLLYKGTLRVLLVLLHDLPEFLCEYHFELVSVVPTTCIQMRNLILSAFPRTMRLPDPFTPNLKVDLLPEIGMPPLFRVPADALMPASLRQETQSYVASRQPEGLPASLARRMALNPTDAMLCDSRYNVPMLNAYIFYVGLTAIPQTKGPFTPKMQSPQMDIFMRLTADMDPEGRHLVINAIANQLRYPNIHTHFFSCVLLHLFLEAPSEVVQEQITRVLLERLIVNRPHPWGLLVTFIELIKNPRYRFWSRAFTHVAPEIERLFDSVAHSCMSSGRPDGGGSASPSALSRASEASRA